MYIDVLELTETSEKNIVFSLKLNLQIYLTRTACLTNCGWYLHCPLLKVLRYFIKRN